MLDLIAMWSKPKMVAFTALTALLYFGLIYPFQQFTFFQGNADYLRVGMCIPLAFSFLFGPAAAWGTAIGNIIYDASTASLGPISIFGFVGNFLIAYLPYTIWNKLATQKPDLRSIKKVGLFAGLALLGCLICGVLIAAGLEWMNMAPFLPTAWVIAFTDALWAIALGSVILAATYNSVSKRGLLYKDILTAE
ncbi:MAG: QueT transporter family protein [Candidatus Bathyarchaeota archaeon]|nr:QueT transporter family protein [Candidatus Bathyarchaeota archaeon]